MTHRRRTALAAGLALLLLAPAGASAQRAEMVHFAPGTSGTTLRGAIAGRDYTDYLLSARAGQTMTATLQSRNTSLYFNVLPPGSEEAIFIGSTSGGHFEGRLPATGEYRVRVYLMSNAGRRGEQARYTLALGVSGGAPAAASPGAHREATGTMPCSFGRASLDRTCPWHVERRAQDVALIRIERPSGGPRLLSVTHGEVAAQGAPVRVQKQGDLWTVTVDGREHYRFAEALLNGG
jgi:hypothetical protein